MISADKPRDVAERGETLPFLIALSVTVYSLSYENQPPVPRQPDQGKFQVYTDFI